MFLLPGTTHIVSWVKQNLLDTAEYYPRAVIRDTVANTVLETLDLTNSGDDIRYTYPWVVAFDPSGQGREVEVEITVYEDSGYSTVSGMYGRWSQRYLIFDFSRAPGGGGFGGSSISYDRVSEIVTSIIGKELGEIKKILETREDKEEKEKEDPIDLTALIESVDGIRETLGDRLRRIIGLGKKVEDAEQVVSLVRGAIADLKSTEKSIASTISDGKKELLSAAREAEIRIKTKTEDELTAATDRFKKIMENSATTLAEKLSTSITAMEKRLSKPLSLQMFAYRGDEEEEEGGKQDKRVGRFL